MATQPNSFPFRWVLPSAQFLVCFIILWPVRSRLLFDVAESIHPVDMRNVLILPSLTPERQQAADTSAKVAELRIRVPLVLNFPVLVAQLPYILAVSPKREWLPKGMSAETWRALCWPFAGLVFWWFLGRAIEALRAVRRSVVHPRLGWFETAFAGVLSCIGVVTVIGIVTSTPDDRGDIQFMALVVGGSLWGILASVTIVARVLQWRLLK